MASVSSTTPRFGPKWPEFVATVRIITSRISAASSSSCSAESPRRSLGVAIESRSAIAPESISYQVVDRHRRLVETAHPHPAVVLAHTRDHVEAGVVDVEVVHQPAVVGEGLDPD